MHVSSTNVAQVPAALSPQPAVSQKRNIVIYGDAKVICFAMIDRATIGARRVCETRLHALNDQLYRQLAKGAKCRFLGAV